MVSVLLLLGIIIIIAIAGGDGEPLSHSDNWGEENKLDSTVGLAGTPDAHHEWCNATGFKIMMDLEGFDIELD